MEQQVAICHPIWIICGVQQEYTWKLFFHKFPIPFFNDKDSGMLMNVEDTSLQEAAANHFSDLFIY